MRGVSPSSLTPSPTGGYRAEVPQALYFSQIWHAPKPDYKKLYFFIKIVDEYRKNRGSEKGRSITKSNFFLPYFFSKKILIEKP
ncbi:MAG: hypothetical protein DRI97_13855 [Bacteroidetes bacterium]|nr:MAG: hypothetical protein DRI97_13855 [Bacteroidota bacterium]